MSKPKRGRCQHPFWVYRSDGHTSSWWVCGKCPETSLVRPRLNTTGA